MTAENKPVLLFRSTLLSLTLLGLSLSCSACGRTTEPLLGPFEVIYEEYGGMPSPPDPNGGGYCAERLRRTVTQDGGHMVGYCTMEDTNRVYLLRSFRPNETTLLPLREALGKLGLDGNVAFRSGGTQGSDDSSFDLKVSSKEFQFFTSSERHNPFLPVSVQELLDSLDVLPFSAEPASVP